MKLKDFRELTHNLPDDTELMVDEGNLVLLETYIRAILPATSDNPSVIWLQTGQCFNFELDIDNRIDKYLGIS